LIGNPYASPISIASLLSSNPNKTTGKIWVLDSKLGSFGGYVTFDGSTWSDPTALHNDSTVIQSGEGFFIKTANIETATASFNIVESLKNENTHSASVFAINTSSKDNFELMRVLLKRVTNNVTSHEDGSTVKFYAGGVNELDESDAEKFPNPSGTISLINGNSELAIEHRAKVVAGDEVFVNVSNATMDTNYKLHIYTENFTFNGTAIFYDLKLGTTTLMPIDGSVFEYPFTVTSDPTTQGTRFKIVFSNSVLSDIAISHKPCLYPYLVYNSESLLLNIGSFENNINNFIKSNKLNKIVFTSKLN
jgi:hypothetical protein